ncbi:hypothetical protein HEP74_03335 [Xanthomonas sp. SS]|nr:hypothetical protein HEP74_03335 [Xanthomonas sp. SS]
MIHGRAVLCIVAPPALGKVNRSAGGAAGVTLP